MAITEQSLLPHLERAMQAAITEEVDAAVAQILEKVQRRVRERMGKIALSLFAEYSVQRQGTDIVITVKNDVR